MQNNGHIPEATPTTLVPVENEVKAAIEPIDQDITELEIAQQQEAETNVFVEPIELEENRFLPILLIGIEIVFLLLLLATTSWATYNYLSKTLILYQGIMVIPITTLIELSLLAWTIMFRYGSTNIVLYVLTLLMRIISLFTVGTIFFCEVAPLLNVPVPGILYSLLPSMIFFFVFVSIAAWYFLRDCTEAALHNYLSIKQHGKTIGARLIAERTKAREQQALKQVQTQGQSQSQNGSTYSLQQRVAWSKRVKALYLDDQAIGEKKANKLLKGDVPLGFIRQELAALKKQQVGK